MSNKWSKEKLSSVVENSRSKAQVLRELGLPIHGGNYRTLDKKIKEYGISTDHFDHLPPERLTGKGGSKIPLDDILVKDSTYNDTHQLKKRLIKKEMVDEECDRCGITHWEGEKLSLHLDHINGIKDDHRLENLRLLCPNCHSLTPTYSGKKLKKEPNTCIDCETEIGRKATRCQTCYNQQRTRVPETTGTCNDCGGKCSRGAKVCRDCYNHPTDRPDKRKFDPSPEELEKLVWEKPASKVGDQFGVSGRAVKKRCRKYGIETPGRGYWTKKRSGKI